MICSAGAEIGVGKGMTLFPGGIDSTWRPLYQGSARTCLGSCRKQNLGLGPLWGCTGCRTLSWKQGYPHSDRLSWHHHFGTVPRDVPWPCPAISLPVAKRSQTWVTNPPTPLLLDDHQVKTPSPQQAHRIPRVTGFVPKRGEGGHLTSLPWQWGPTTLPPKPPSSWGPASSGGPAHPQGITTHIPGG